MKLTTIMIAAILTLGLSTFAAETTVSEKTEVNAQVEEKPLVKKVRKKKVQMCGECGKVETECECDHSNEKKKEEKK
jgi:hypothetical protein